MPVKLCEVCRLPITWRKRWEKNWESITVCSERCRRDKPFVASLRSDPDVADGVKAAILRLTARGSSVCPSEVAREIFETEREWRAAMVIVREVSMELHEDPRSGVEITQKGKRIRTTPPIGPFRLNRTG